MDLDLDLECFVLEDYIGLGPGFGGLNLGGTKDDFPGVDGFTNMIQNEKGSSLIDVYKFECDKCGKIFKHKKSMKRHNSSQPYCHKTNEVNTVQFDIDQFSRTLREKLALK